MKQIGIHNMIEELKIELDLQQEEWNRLDGEFREIRTQRNSVEKNIERINTALISLEELSQ